MDSLTHLFLTRKFINKGRSVVVAGVAPDIPFYFTYPAFVVQRGQLKHALKTNDWPDPPIWMETAHHMFHSFPLLLVLAAVVRVVRGRVPHHFFLAWAFHILIDIPTHSRRRWGPQFLWPISTYSFDGLSWVEIALRLARTRAEKAK